MPVKGDRKGEVKGRPVELKGLRESSYMRGKEGERKGKAG